MAPCGATCIWFLLVCIILLVYSPLSVGRVTQSSNVTVFINQPAVFPCVTTRNSVTWRVNGTNFDDLPSEIHSDLVTSRTMTAGIHLFALTIPGIAGYNGTTVQCVTGSHPGENKIATLRVQGQLASVGDLTIDNNAASINISWSAPFSLDVTDVDPDIWYTVLIYNMTDETTVSYPNCTNINETYCVFSPDHPSPCHQYTFTVIPFNGAGQGESSQNVTGYTIDNLRPDVQFNRSGIEVVDNGYTKVTFHILGDVESVCGYTLRGVDEAPLEDGGFVIYLLPANRKYSITFELSNAFGTWDSSNDTFSTFDIQDARAEGKGSQIAMTGEFINNSLAMGCFVVVQCNKSTPDQFQALLRKGSEESISEGINVHPSNYTVYVYDLEETGLPNPMPAVTPRNKIIIMNDSKFNAATTSTFLTRAELSRDGSKVTIRCEIAVKYPEASCVLIYREYNKTMLTVREYNHSTVFPVSETVDSSKNYTFAVFGKNSKEAIDKKPLKVVKSEAFLMKPPSGKDKGAKDTVGVIVGSVVAGVLIAAVAVIVSVVLLWKRKVLYMISGNEMQKKKEAVLEEKGAAYHKEESGECVRTVTLAIGRQNSTAPLLAIRSDGGRENEAIDMKGEGGTSTEKEEGKEESKYASVVTSNPLGVQPPLSVDQPVQYDVIDVKATKRQAHPHGLHYTEVAPPPDSQGSGRNRILDDPATKYATVLPHTPSPADGSPAVEDKKSKEKKMSQQQKSEAQGPPTVEAVVSLLRCVAVHWRAIAEGLGFDEDHIDEIDTNNETDVACLQDCMKQWMRLGPTWKKLALVLSDVGEDSLAQQAWSGDDVGGSHSQNTSKWETFQEDDDDESFQSMSEETSQSGDGQLVTENFTPTQNASKDDENRGRKVAMSKEHSVEQHGNVVVTQSNVLQEESPIDIADNMYLSEEENGNTETEPTSSVECSSDHEDVALVMYGGTSHHISTLHLTSSSGCFESPPPSFQCYCDCDNVGVVTTADDDHDQYSNPTEMEACQQETGVNHDVVSIVCQSFSKPQRAKKAGCRKVSDTGPIAVLPQPCTEVQTGEAAVDRAQYGGAVFNSKTEGQAFEEFTSVKRGLPATLSTQQKRKLVVVPLRYLLDDDVMVTGGMYSNPYYVDCTKMQASFVTVGRPVLNSSRAEKPSCVEDTQPQQPPEANPPQKRPENFERGQLSKVNTPFKKRQWSDPPENYQERMQKWTHTGIALGFHGPDNLIIIDGNSHYG